MNETRFPLVWPVGVPRHKYRSSNSVWKQSYERVRYERVRDDLSKELDRLHVSNIIISTNARTSAFGMPKGDERPADPGVAVYFTRKEKRLCMSCDRWSSVRENMKAITQSIEAIRGLERWGTSDMVERAFTGFAQLPQSIVPPRPWRDVLGFNENEHVDDDYLTTRFRLLATQCHPDTRGGSHEAMTELNAARAAAIRELHG